MTKDEALDLALEALELSAVTVDSFGVQKKTQEAITAIKQARSAPVQDAEGENKAVRSFLMLYGQPGLTVGQMKKHMTMSGFKSWPTWVETEHDGAHLTKAGAQLWIRHLFALDDTPPAQRQWVGLTFGEICEVEVIATDEHNNFSLLTFARAIEAKLKEKNT